MAAPQPHTGSRLEAIARRLALKDLAWGISLIEAPLFLAALLSLAYSIATAPARGIDIVMFQDMGRAWVEGANLFKTGPFYGPPPIAQVLFSLLAPLTAAQAKVAMLALNLIAAGVVVHLALRLWGAAWPARARLHLAALFVAWAPFRITLRNGQINLLAMAMLFAALVAREKKKHALAGLLFGLSLIKYPLTFPFFLYFAWKREWKIVAASAVAPALLLVVFAARLRLSPLEAMLDYARAALEAAFTKQTHLMGSTELKPLFLAVSGGNELLTAALTALLFAAALVCMAIAFKRRPLDEDIHFALLALFALWSVYHRPYDATLCIVPAAVLIGFIVKGRFARFGAAWLAGLGLLVLGLPGLLTDRLRLSAESLSSNPLLFLGVHSERLLVFAMFCSLLLLLWRAKTEPSDRERLTAPAT